MNGLISSVRYLRTMAVKAELRRRLARKGLLGPCWDHCPAVRYDWWNWTKRMPQ